MEIFDRGNFQESQLIRKICLHPIIYVKENYSCKRAVMYRSAEPTQVHARVLPVILLPCFNWNRR